MHRLQPCYGINIDGCVIKPSLAESMLPQSQRHLRKGSARASAASYQRGHQSWATTGGHRFLVGALPVHLLHTLSIEVIGY